MTPILRELMMLVGRGPHERVPSAMRESTVLNSEKRKRGFPVNSQLRAQLNAGSVDSL